MIKSKIISLIVLLSISLVLSQSDIKSENNILILTDDNFNQALNKYPSIFIKFYAPWCGHCKRLAPELDKVANDKEHTVKIAKIDCTENKGKCSEYGIRGYPTLIYFANKVQTKYNEERSAAALVSWLKKKQNPTTEIKSESEIDEIRKKLTDGQFIAVLVGNKNISKFNDMVSNIDGATFYYCISKDCIDYLNSAEGSVVILNKTKNYKNVLAANFNEHQLKSFILKEHNPPLAFMNKFTYLSIIKERKKAVILFYDLNSVTEVENLAFALKEKLNGEIQILYSQTSTEPEQSIINVFHIEIDSFPKVVLVDSSGSRNKKYYFKKKNLNPDDVFNWVNDCKNGKLDFDIKSEPIPSTQGYVKKVVGHTFESIVKDETKDVFIKYYSPTCPHCVKVAPIIEELAKKYSNDKNIVIADVNARDNELEFMMGAFPSFHLWPAGKNKKSIYYDVKERTVESFTEFIEKNRTFKQSKNKDDL